MMPTLDLVVVLLGLAASLFLGFSACRIFKVDWPASPAGRVYLFWFNFCGSALGWAALWLLLRRFEPCAYDSCRVDVSLSDFVLALVAFAGITGHIPMTTMGVFTSLGDLARRVLKDHLRGAA